MSKGANDNNNGMSGRSVGGRAITRKAMLCIVGAFLFIFGTLFERHLWTQRTKGKDLSSDSKDRSERVTAKRPSTSSLSLHFLLIGRPRMLPRNVIKTLCARYTCAYRRKTQTSLRLPMTRYEARSKKKRIDCQM